MTLLDSVKELFHIDISKLKSLVSITFVTNQTTNKFEIVNQEGIINTGKLTGHERKTLKRFTKEEVLRKGSILLEKKAKTVLDDITTTQNLPNNEALLTFFKGKIPPIDYEILRASLVIRAMHEAGKGVTEIKDGLVSKYGDRGRNIANLCSAGYFENLIRPLYEEMNKDRDFSQQKFLDRYDVIITQVTFAVFVSHRMSYEDLKIRVKKKMIINKQYGIDFLHLHGIGEVNIAKINRFLKELSDQLRSVPKRDEDERYINVTIFF